MKISLLLLTSAAVLSLGACSQDKTATTTGADSGAMTTAATGPEADAALEARAQRIADKMVADMKITDEATKAKIRAAYLNRSRRLTGVRSKYTTDTTGMAAAMRAADTETDTEFKDVFTDPAQYQTYESSRTTYDDSNYPDDAAATGTPGSTPTDASATDNSTSTAPADASGSATSDATTGADASAGSSPTDAATKSKSKMADGSKIKTKEDGTIKLKDASGNKSKIK